MRYFRLFLSMPRTARLMVFQAFFLSAWYRFRILFVPFRRLAARMGTHGYETPNEPVNDEFVLLVSRLVPAVCRHTPWQSLCFVQSLTAKHMLNRKGLPVTIYMGVCRDEDGKMAAHSWLRCGTAYVTGGNGTLKYAVTGVWGDAPADAPQN